jgi:addiction module RelE/StbE family toxin
MDIFLNKNFEKSFSKLPHKQQIKVDETISAFQENPHDPQLRNHALHGEQKGQRSLSVGGNLRIIFVEENNYETVELLTVGTHNQVYK